METATSILTNLTSRDGATRMVVLANGTVRPPTELPTLWDNFQTLPWQVQLGVVGIVVTVVGGVIKFIQWAIEKRMETSRHREQLARLDRQDQQARAERQAEWRFEPDPANGDLLTIGPGIASGRDFLRLMGTVQNVGLAIARLRNLQAFIDGQELPWGSPSAPRRGQAQPDELVTIRFGMPYRLEQVGPASDWNTNTLFVGKIVRVVITYADDTGNREAFVKCFRFEPSPRYQQWSGYEVNPCPP
jgi:hypothetical protein